MAGAGVRHGVPDLLDQVRPDLVLDNAGGDPRRDDRLGRLGLRDLDLLQRHAIVVRTDGELGGFFENRC